MKEALTYLVAKKVYDYSGEGYGKIKKIIQDKQNESRYAFVPNKDEVRRLQQFITNPRYKELQLLLPNYRYIDLIRTGLLIDYYLKNKSKKNSERVKRIKSQILKRPNGTKLLKIANLPTTPFFTLILNYLYHLKNKNYSEAQLEEVLDERISHWRTSSMLVETKDSVDDVISFCEKQISMEKSPFLVLGMKSAAETVEKAFEQLIKKNFLSKEGYTYKMTKQPEGVKPRVELMIFRQEIC